MQTTATVTGPLGSIALPRIETMLVIFCNKYYNIYKAKKELKINTFLTDPSVSDLNGYDKTAYDWLRERIHGSCTRGAASFKLIFKHILDNPEKEKSLKLQNSLSFCSFDSKN